MTNFERLKLISSLVNMICQLEIKSVHDVIDFNRKGHALAGKLVPSRIFCVIDPFRVNKSAEYIANIPSLNK